MSKQFWIDTRDKPGLLIAVMRALAGAAEISFEGGLGHSGLAGIPCASAGETAALRRSDLSGVLDFLVLPLTDESVPAIWRVITEREHLAYPSGIIHVQIARRGPPSLRGLRPLRPELRRGLRGFSDRAPGPSRGERRDPLLPGRGLSRHSLRPHRRPCCTLAEAARRIFSTQRGKLPLFWCMAYHTPTGTGDSPGLMGGNKNGQQVHDLSLRNGHFRRH